MINRQVGSTNTYFSGGVDNHTHAHAVASAFAYSPTLNRWSSVASLPSGDYGMSASNANGRMQLVGSANSDSAALEYDPLADRWLSLPSTAAGHFRGGSSCGLAAIGGDQVTKTFIPEGGPKSEVLQGYSACGTDDVPWLSETNATVSLAPGQSVTMRVNLDSSKVAQPGSYAAQVQLVTDSPYAAVPVQVVLTASAPSSWALISGTVTDAQSGQPLANAVVQVCTMYQSNGACGPQAYTLRTTAAGEYHLWLSSGFTPLHVIATVAGHQPGFAIVRLSAGQETVTSFVLARTPVSIQQKK